MRDKDSIIGETQQSTASAPTDYLQRAFLMSVFQKMPKPLYDGDGYVAYEKVGLGSVSIHVEVQQDIGDVCYSKPALLWLMVKAIFTLLMQSPPPVRLAGRAPER